MMKLNAIINGKKLVLDIAPNAMLLEVLRSNGFKGVKKGCGEGSCGSCAVLIDGRPRNSCLVFAAHCEGASIETVEGLGTPEHPHPLQQAFVEHGATQCGFCNPGSLLVSKALLESNPHPTEADVKEALDGNLCRCTGYVKRIEAVLAAAGKAKKPARNSGGKK